MLWSGTCFSNLSWSLSLNRKGAQMLDEWKRWMCNLVSCSRWSWCFAQIHLTNRASKCPAACEKCNWSLMPVTLERLPLANWKSKRSNDTELQKQWDLCTMISFQYPASVRACLKSLPYLTLSPEVSCYMCFSWVQSSIHPYLRFCSRNLHQIQLNTFSFMLLLFWLYSFLQLCMSFFSSHFCSLIGYRVLEARYMHI